MAVLCKHPDSAHSPDETALPSVYFCPLLNLAMSSPFKSAECGSHSALLVVSVVSLCINNSTSLSTSNGLRGAETRLAVPDAGVDFLASSAQTNNDCLLDTCRMVNTGPK